MGAVAGEDSRESPEGQRLGVSEFPSYLKMKGERSLSKGAAAVGEEVVVGTCVYYYLPGPGHDAGSRIGITHLCSAWRRFGSNWGRQGVVQSGTGRQECGGVRGL